MISAEPWGPHALISYYGDGNFTLDVRTIGFSGELDDRDSCKAELTVAKAAIAAATGAPVDVAVCLPDSDAEIDSGHHMNVGLRSDVVRTTYGQIDGPAYGSYAACRDDRAQAVAALSQASGRVVTGAVCVRTTSFQPFTYKIVGILK